MGNGYWTLRKISTILGLTRRQKITGWLLYTKIVLIFFKFNTQHPIPIDRVYPPSFAWLPSPQINCLDRFIFTVVTFMSICEEMSGFTHKVCPMDIIHWHFRMYICLARCIFVFVFVFIFVSQAGFCPLAPWESTCCLGTFWRRSCMITLVTLGLWCWSVIILVTMLMLMKINTVAQCSRK